MLGNTVPTNLLLRGRAKTPLELIPRTEPSGSMFCQQPNEYQDVRSQSVFDSEYKTADSADSTIIKKLNRNYFSFLAVITSEIEINLTS